MSIYLARRDITGMLQNLQRLGETARIEMTGAFGVDGRWSMPVAFWQTDADLAAWSDPNGWLTLAVVREMAPDGIVWRGTETTRHHVVGVGRTGVTLMLPEERHYFGSDGPVAFAHLYIDPLALWRLADEAGIAARELQADAVFVEDPAIERAAHDYLDRALTEIDPPSPLEMDARAILISLGVLRRFGVDRGERHRSAGKLAPWQLRRVMDLMEASPPQEISLQRLSSVVGLSAQYFCRAFKSTVGLAPNQWMVRRRMERARELLTQGNLSVADVAAALGYEDQTGLARAFKRCFGTTPAAFRRGSRS